MEPMSSQQPSRSSCDNGQILYHQATGNSSLDRSLKKKKKKSPPVLEVLKNITKEFTCSRSGKQMCFSHQGLLVSRSPTPFLLSLPFLPQSHLGSSGLCFYRTGLLWGSRLRRGMGGEQWRGEIASKNGRRCLLLSVGLWKFHRFLQVGRFPLFLSTMPAQSLVWLPRRR